MAQNGARVYRPHRDITFPGLFFFFFLLPFFFGWMDDETDETCNSFV